jgi:hypothetical protein
MTSVFISLTSTTAASVAKPVAARDTTQSFQGDDKYNTPIDTVNLGW